MPIYEYQCRSCKHEFEARMTISKRDTAVCPKCGGKKARRLVSMFYSQAGDGGGSSCSCSGGGCSGGGSCGSCKC